LTVVCKAKPTPIKHIWFLPTQINAITTKPKELDFRPTHRDNDKKKTLI